MSILLRELARAELRKREWGECYWTANDLFYQAVAYPILRPYLDVEVTHIGWAS